MGPLSAGRVAPQSSMKTGFTNHRWSAPRASWSSQGQLAGWAAGVVLGASSPRGPPEFSPPEPGFSEESQKPVGTREEEAPVWAGHRGGWQRVSTRFHQPDCCSHWAVRSLSHHFLLLQGKPRPPSQPGPGFRPPPQTALQNTGQGDTGPACCKPFRVGQGPHSVRASSPGLFYYRQSTAQRTPLGCRAKPATSHRKPCAPVARLPVSPPSLHGGEWSGEGAGREL